MKKISLLVFALFLIASAGDWGYENVEGASGTLFSFDTIEAFYSTTMEVSNGKKIPTSFFITHWLTPDTSTASTGDSVDFHISLDYSNDRTNWYSFGDIDTVDLDNTAVSTEAQVNGSVGVTPYDFRYMRLQLQSNTVDTFSVFLQKSYETE